MTVFANKNIQNHFDTLLRLYELGIDCGLDVGIKHDEITNSIEVAITEDETVTFVSDVIYLEKPEAIGEFEKLLIQLKALIKPTDNVHSLNAQHVDANAPMITIYGGEMLNLHKPGHTNFSIETISHHLSMICRFGGGADWFYSVAQHSVHVSKLVPDSLALAALMHDAAEAFVGDVPTPWKRHLSHLENVENNLLQYIFEQFGIPFPLTSAIKKADLIALKTERLVLKPQDNPAHWMFLDHINADDLSVIQPLTHEQAKQAFLDRFYELQPFSVALA